MVPHEVYEAAQPLIQRFVYERGFCEPLPPPPTVGGAAYEVLASLLSLEQTSQTKRNHCRLRSDPLRRLARYEAGEGIEALARELQLPPTKVARDLLEGLLDVKRSSVKDYLRSPELIATCALKEDSMTRLGSAGVAHLCKRLAADVAQCIERDLKDSPLLDSVRAWSGDEHEWRLAATLGALGIPPSALLTEEELRQGGGCRRSTPDILFRWPIAIPCPHRAATVRLVCWVDSKASFADPQALDGTSMGIRSQVLKYLCDFGPGMTVFWGGFVDSLVAVAEEAFEGGLVIYHRPPAQWRWATEEEFAGVAAFRESWHDREEGGGNDPSPAPLPAAMLPAPPAAMPSFSPAAPGSSAHRRLPLPAAAAEARKRVWEDMLASEAQASERR
jgi:hypothetical protein